MRLAKVSQGRSVKPASRKYERAEAKAKYAELEACEYREEGDGTACSQCVQCLRAEILTLRAELAQAKDEVALLKGESAHWRADATGHMFRCAKVNGVWVCAKGCAKASLATYIEGAHQIAQEMQAEAATPKGYLASRVALQIEDWAEAILALGTAPHTEQTPADRR